MRVGLRPSPSRIRSAFAARPVSWIPSALYVAVLVLAVAASAGCQSFEQGRQAGREGDSLRVQYQHEQQRSQELAAANKRLQQQVEQLERALATTGEKLARTEREWQEMRDELLRYKIEQEQRRGPRSTEGMGADATKPKLPAERQARNEELKAQLKELLQQLERLLHEH